ncbi:MAG TPA: dienelactone hydrolase family protein [Kofleriaceae bacterium]
MRTEIVAPDGAGPWPGVILCFDAGGPRPAMTAIAERISRSGYLVAIPDLYHRVGRIVDLLPEGVPKDEPARIIPMLADSAIMKQFMTTFYASATDYDHIQTDLGAVLDHFDQRPDVQGGVGTTGYCMGGNISVRAATIFGDRIAATAAFHAGGIAVPQPDSPHLRVRAIRSRVYVAGAIEDRWFTDDMKQQLETALTEAGVDHTVETYPARHGFAVSDNPTYDAESAERHFQALVRLYTILA